MNLFLLLDVSYYITQLFQNVVLLSKDKSLIKQLTLNRGSSQQLIGSITSQLDLLRATPSISPLTCLSVCLSVTGKTLSRRRRSSLRLVLVRQITCLFEFES